MTLELIYQQTNEVLYMSKIYISIYAPNNTQISNLHRKLMVYSERFNNEQYKSSLDIHLTKKDMFNSNLDTQYMVYRKVYSFKYSELTEHQLLAICTFSSLISKEAYHDIEIVNFKIQNSKNNLFRLIAYIPITI